MNRTPGRRRTELFFFLGDRCARRPLWLQGVVLVALLALNLATARGYAVGRWAY